MRLPRSSAWRKLWRALEGALVEWTVGCAVLAALLLVVLAALAALSQVGGPRR